MNSRAIADGLRLAAGLNVPLKIAGKPVFVSDEIAASLAVEVESERSSSLPGLTETARAIAWLLRQAEHELETVGIESGILNAAAASPSSPAAKPAVLAQSPRPPVRFGDIAYTSLREAVAALYAMEPRLVKTGNAHRMGQ
jgi:hypothetical protein